MRRNRITVFSAVRRTRAYFHLFDEPPAVPSCSQANPSAHVCFCLNLPRVTRFDVRHAARTPQAWQNDRRPAAGRRTGV
jgi:hypothetical protein